MSDIEKRLLSIPAEKFKKAFIEWYAESSHQGWNGMAEDMVIEFTETFLNDFAAYCVNGGLEDAGGFFQFGGENINTMNLLASREPFFKNWELLS